MNKDNAATSNVNHNGEVLPPHSDEVERCALACILGASPDEAKERHQRTNEEHYYDLRHKTIHAVCGEVLHNGQSFDVASVYASLSKQGKVEDAGGLDYLQRIPDASSPTLWETWFAQLEEFRQRRFDLAESARLRTKGLDGLAPSSIQHIPTDDETFRRLAALTLLEYDRCRKAEAKKLNISVGTLDAEVIKRRVKPEQKTNVSEPWPDAVDGMELLGSIVSTFNRFCKLPPHAAELLAIWVLQTYCYLKFEFVAIVAIWSPEPECGKGRVLDVIEVIVSNVLRTANTSAAVLYHSVSKGGITVLIDELDSQSEDQREAIGNILKSGFQANGKAHRMAERNGEQTVVEFCTFSPKAIACIGLDCLDKATRSRSISIRMQRKGRNDKLDKFRRFDATEIRRKCLRWVEDNMVAIESVRPLELNECASDRQEDVWEPLVQIARIVGGDWERKIRDAAGAMSGKASTEAMESIGHKILSTVKEYFERNGTKADTKSLLEVLNAGGDFTDINRGRGLTAYFLAKTLKPYGIESRNLKMADGTVKKGYDQGDFTEAFDTYLTELSLSKRYSATTPANIEQNPLFQSATNQSGSVSKNSIPTNKDGPGSGVADSKPQTTPEKVYV